MVNTMYLHRKPAARLELCLKYDTSQRKILMLSDNAAALTKHYEKQPETIGEQVTRELHEAWNYITGNNDDVAQARKGVEMAQQVDTKGKYLPDLTIQETYKGDQKALPDLAIQDGSGVKGKTKDLQKHISDYGD